MAYAGLETLFQNMGPTYAASMAGEREGTALGLDQLTAQKEREAILKAQEENRQAQIMNPLNALYRQGEVNKQGAELPGVQAKSRSEGINADIAGETKASTVGKTNSDNVLAVQGNKLKEMATRQQMANQIVSQIIAQGPVAGEAYRRQLEAQNPEVARMLGGIPTNQLQAAQAHANEWLNKQTAAYQQAMATAQMQKDSHLAGIGIQTRSNEKLEGMRIEAGKYEKKAAGKSMYQSYQAMSPDKRIGITSMALESGFNPFTQEPLTPQERTQFQALHDQDARTINGKLNAAAAGKPDTGALGIAANPAIDVTKKVESKAQGKGTPDDPIVIK